MYSFFEGFFSVDETVKSIPVLCSKTFLAHFRVFGKAANLFNATGHHACSPTPTKISIDILLLASKTSGIKLA